jgi:hypothetical protein
MNIIEDGVSMLKTEKIMILPDGSAHKMTFSSHIDMIARMINLEWYSTANDVRLPKNNAADTGQKESAKITPSKNAPKKFDVSANF